MDDQKRSGVDWAVPGYDNMIVGLSKRIGEQMQTEAEEAFEHEVLPSLTQLNPKSLWTIAYMVGQQALWLQALGSSPGFADRINDVDRTFYKLTVQQRDAAWRRVEALEKELAELQARHETELRDTIEAHEREIAERDQSAIERAEWS